MICLIFPSVLGGLPRRLEGPRSYADLSFQERALSSTDSRVSFAAWSGSVSAALPYSTSLPEREKRIKGIVSGIWVMRGVCGQTPPTSWNPEEPYEAEQNLPILSAHNFISPDF